MKALEFPLTKISVAFVLGICSAALFSIPTTIILLSIGVALLTLFTTYFYSEKHPEKKWTFGWATYFLVSCIGIFTCNFHNQTRFQNHYLNSLNQNQDPVLEMVLTEKLRSSAKNVRYFAELYQMDEKPTTGKILVYIPNELLVQKLAVGTVLKVKAPLVPIKKAFNPDQFDYGNYLKNKSVYAQVFTKNAPIYLGQHPQKGISYYTDKIRQNIISQLENAHFKKEELHVVNALLLGQQQDISKEIMTDYQYAGAVHVLSVSGLHVGFIMLFLGFLLKSLPKTPLWNTIKIILILLGLWGFAFLAGLAPSVVRSTVMFSFMAVGLHLKRHTNIYHTLLVSAFVILLFQPSYLFDIGFQLSYIALFFIVWLQPLFKSLWEPQYKVIEYFWDILTVSFAAQIGTFPLSLYYFHQFPGLFFVTNLIIIPFLSVIMAIGVLVAILVSINLVPQFMLKSLEFCIQILNAIIKWVASFKSFVFQDIPFNTIMLVSCYLLIFSFFVWWKQPRVKYLYFSLISVIVLQFSIGFSNWKLTNEKESLVFHIPKKTLLAERVGKKIRLYSNGNPLTKDEFEFSIKPYLVSHFAEEIQQLEIQNTVCLNNNKILIIDQEAVYPINCKPDVLLLTQSPKVNLDRLIERLNPKLIIADGSNYKSYVSYFETICNKRKIPFHATAEKGFYKFNF